MKYIMLFLLALNSQYILTEEVPAQENRVPNTQVTSQQLFYAWLAQRYLHPAEAEVLHKTCGEKQFFEMVASGSLKTKSLPCIELATSIIRGFENDPLFSGELEKNILQASLDDPAAEEKRKNLPVNPENFTLDQAKLICAEEYKYYNAGMDDFIASHKDKPMRNVVAYRQLKSPFLFHCAGNNRPIDTFWACDKDCPKQLNSLLNIYRKFQREREISMEIPNIYS